MSDFPMSETDIDAINAELEAAEADLAEEVEDQLFDTHS